MMRRGFTIIEVLVSVVLISIVVLGIIKIEEQNQQVAYYISGRVKAELANTLFLTPKVLRYDKSEKSAYMLLDRLHGDKDATRQALKSIKRMIHISDPLPLGDLPIPVEVRAIMLKSEYSARYYRIKF
jgi:prepilin-type N-terminal cleavage/methylation domain-containing protein